jgi:hypothetical protein
MLEGPFRIDFSLIRIKLFLAGATYGTYPFIRKVFKRDAGRDVALLISLCRVIHISADTANILFHFSTFLLSILHDKRKERVESFPLAGDIT